MSKDLFSEQAKTYARFRPNYPKEMFEYILQFVEQRDCAWDCATGNGQAAIVLADYFKKVEASDLSEAQIKNAVSKENIEYHLCPAENTPFQDNSFDLITVATAYHWLDWKGFHKEAVRTSKKNGVVAVWAYNLITSDEGGLNQLIHHFYYDIVYPYWDPERRHVENAYANVNFDFDLLPSREFSIDAKWNKEEFKGYLKSWSSVQHYINKNHSSPVELISKELDEVWSGAPEKEFRFPLFLKIGRAG